MPQYPIAGDANADDTKKARSTQTVIRDWDRHQHLTVCSLAHCQHSLKISRKSVRKFLRKVANRQRDKQTVNDENITSFPDATI